MAELRTHTHTYTHTSVGHLCVCKTYTQADERAHTIYKHEHIYIHFFVPSLKRHKSVFMHPHEHKPNNPVPSPQTHFRAVSRDSKPVEIIRPETELDRQAIAHKHHCSVSFTNISAL